LLVVSTDLSIRPLRRTDLKRIFSPPVRDHGHEWLRLQDRSEAYVAVAELQGVPLARANLHLTLKAAERAGQVWAAHVEPPFQSRGIGTALFVHLEHVARRQGFHTLRLAVGKANPRARRLYERLGFEVRGDETTCWSYREGRRVVDVVEDCWTMEKLLAE
jgi:ribosomal protein S18 acetylase RimI-like enzyme